MSIDRFAGEVPHHIDTNLLERCQEQLRDYDIGYKGWVEPKNHTISYLAAAYLELAKKYDELTNTTAFEAQMEAIVEETYQDALSRSDEE